jgi:hypothetical protein
MHGVIILIKQSCPYGQLAIPSIQECISKENRKNTKKGNNQSVTIKI